jgi:hypothetical protein
MNENDRQTMNDILAEYEGRIARLRQIRTRSIGNPVETLINGLREELCAAYIDEVIRHDLLQICSDEILRLISAMNKVKLQIAEL